MTLYVLLVSYIALTRNGNNSNIINNSLYRLLRFSISKGSLNSCPTSMSVSTTCPSDPYTSLWALNGTRRNPSETSYDWQTDKYSVSEDSESVTVIVRYQPWSYEKLKVIYSNFAFMLFVGVYKICRYIKTQYNDGTISYCVCAVARKNSYFLYIIVS